MWVSAGVVSAGAPGTGKGFTGHEAGAALAHVLHLGWATRVKVSPG